MLQILTFFLLDLHFCLFCVSKLFVYNIFAVFRAHVSYDNGPRIVESETNFPLGPIKYIYFLSTTFPQNHCFLKQWLHDGWMDGWMDKTERKKEKKKKERKKVSKRTWFPMQ